MDTKKLKLWFKSQSRDLPWRNAPTPYAVWVSEVMLQQTQVAVVIPYFERWMAQFPTVHTLASAPIEQVLKAWEGLGYYSRARNLHEGAKYLVEHCNGILPSTPEQLLKIKGIGSYTAGAILSFAYHKRMAAVDGNVLRVMARYYGIESDISLGKTVKEIQTLTQGILPEEEAWVVSEALIELGATVCTKQPGCDECPIRKGCSAYATKRTGELPVKSAGAKTTKLYRTVAVIEFEGNFLIGTGAKGRVMADLCEFPYIETECATAEYKSIVEQMRERHHLEIRWSAQLPEVKHSFTRYNAHLTPHLFSASNHCDVEGYRWVSLEELKSLPFSSGHKKVLSNIKGLG